MAHLSLCSTPYKLTLGVAGYHAIRSSDITRSCEVMGLWPMDFSLVKWAENKENDEKENLVSQGNVSSFDYPGTRLVGVQRRQTDSEVYRKITNIVESTQSPSEGISKIKRMLEHHKSVHDILSATKRSLSEMIPVKTVAEKRVVLLVGAPAAHLTVSELIKHREEGDKNAKEKEEAKAQRRRERRETTRKVYQQNKLIKKTAKKKGRKKGILATSGTGKEEFGRPKKSNQSSYEDAKVSREVIAVDHDNHDKAAAALVALGTEVPNSAPF